MKMRLGLPYWTRSKVVEFEPNRQIAWCHLAGHRWRWQVEPEGQGQSRVAETFDMATALSRRRCGPLAIRGLTTSNVAASVGNVVTHFKGDASPA